MNNYWQRGYIPKISSRCGATLFWSGTDTEENFKKSPKPGYTKTSIVYKYNSYGYRTREFDLTNSIPSIICIGCSFTEAIGINYEDSWVAQIEKNFPQHVVYNFGVGGSSGDAVARTLYNISGVITPSIVFVLWTDIYRYEQYQELKIATVYPHVQNGYTPTMLTDENFNNIRQRNRAMVGLLATVNNYTVYEHNIHDFDMSIHDQGRDDHPGPQWHAEMARTFLKKYDQHKI
jgi:hypothetical protein